MGVALRVVGIASLVRLTLAGTICVALGWGGGFDTAALFVPYLLYEGTAVTWPRLSGATRYAPVAVFLVVLGALVYVFRVSALVGVGVLPVLALALDYLPLEATINTVLSKDIDSITDGESRFGPRDEERRTRQFPLEVEPWEESVDNGTCPDCGVNLNLLLVGSHCPRCGNPEVVGDVNQSHDER